MHIKLVRAHRVLEATYGVLIVEDSPLCLTLELPWLNNEPFVSCIPTGAYTCKRVQSPKWGDTFEVADVPGRTHILFHWGNSYKNSKGCVLLGRSFSHVDQDDVMDVASSRDAFSAFMDALNGEESFKLEVV